MGAPIDVDTFAATVRQAAEGTPYEVTNQTRDGFSVGADLGSPAWLDPDVVAFDETFVHHVRCRPDRFSIVDDLYAVAWSAGVPSVSGGATRVMGRVWRRGVRRTWERGADGKLRQVGKEQFDSDEGRRLITTAAKSLGYRYVWSTPERIGIVFGVIGAAGAVVTLIALLVFVLLGRF